MMYFHNLLESVHWHLSRDDFRHLVSSCGWNLFCLLFLFGTSTLFVHRHTLHMLEHTPCHVTYPACRSDLCTDTFMCISNCLLCVDHCFKYALVARQSSDLLVIVLLSCHHSRMYIYMLTPTNGRYALVLVPTSCLCIALVPSFCALTLTPSCASPRPAQVLLRASAASWQPPLPPFQAASHFRMALNAGTVNTV
jgi:hypothetical protein